MSDAGATIDVSGLQRRNAALVPGKILGNAASRARVDGHATRFRAKRLKYAIATSLLSKGGAAILQLVAIPIAIRSLGVQNYALYVGMVAVVGWIGMATINVGPALVVQMAAAAAAEDKQAQRRLFTSALVPMGVNALLLAAGVLLAMSCFSAVRLFNVEFAEQERTIYACLWILGAMQLIQPLFAVVEGAQAGYQEQYLLNLRGLVGNLGCVALLVLMPWWPTVIFMVVAMHGPPFLSRLANVVWFLSKRPFLLPTAASFSWRDCRSIVGDGFFFSLAATVTAYLCHQLPVVVLGWTLGAQATASFAAGLTVITVAIGVVSMICIPIWPAVSDSLSRGDSAWANRACIRVIALCTGYAVAVGLVLAAFGPRLFEMWLGDSLHPSRLFFVMLGIYFILQVWEYTHYMILIGAQGVRLPSLLYLVRGVVAAGMVIWLGHIDADYVAFSALCASVGIVTAVTFPYLTYRALARHASAVAGAAPMHWNGIPRA